MQLYNVVSVFNKHGLMSKTQMNEEAVTYNEARAWASKFSYYPHRSIQIERAN